MVGIYRLNELLSKKILTKGISADEFTAQYVYKNFNIIYNENLSYALKSINTIVTILSEPRELRGRLMASIQWKRDNACRQSHKWIK